MMFGDTNSGIVEKKKREVVAEVYDDKWNEGIVRVQFEERPDREMDINALRRMVKREGWEEEFFGNSANQNLQLYKTWTKRMCSSCDSKPLYDSIEDEWYCSRCDG